MNINGFKTGNTQVLVDQAGNHHEVRVELKVILPANGLTVYSQAIREAWTDRIQKQLVECLPTSFQEIEDRLPAAIEEPEALPTQKEN